MNKKRKIDSTYKWSITSLIFLILALLILPMNISPLANLTALVLFELSLISLLISSVMERKKEELQYFVCLDSGFDYDNEVDLYAHIGCQYDAKKHKKIAEPAGRIQLSGYTTWKSYILNKNCDWNDDFIRVLKKKRRDAKLYLDVIKGVLVPGEIGIITSCATSDMDMYKTVLLVGAATIVAMYLVIKELQNKDNEKHFLKDLIELLSEELEKKEKELSASIKRIKKYEKIIDGAKFAMTLKDASISTDLKALICKLDIYYQSSEWKIDHGYDEAGLLPPDLKRGVLSEDGIYNLLEEYKEL